MRSALNQSTIFHSIVFRGATGPDARSEIQGDTLPRLGDEQWKTEAERLFQASLARIQYDALDIGEGATFVGDKKYPDKPDSHYKRDMPFDSKAMCGISTFSIPKDHENIRVWPTLLVTFFIPLSFGLLGLRLDKALFFGRLGPFRNNKHLYQLDEAKYKSDWYRHEGKHILVAWIFRWAAQFLFPYLSGFYNTLVGCCNPRSKTAGDNVQPASSQVSNSNDGAPTARPSSNVVAGTVAANATGVAELASNKSDSTTRLLQSQSGTEYNTMSPAIQSQEVVHRASSNVSNIGARSPGHSPNVINEPIDGNAGATEKTKQPTTSPKPSISSEPAASSTDDPAPDPSK